MIWILLLVAIIVFAFKFVGDARHPVLSEIAKIILLTLGLSLLGIIF